MQSVCSVCRQEESIEEAKDPTKGMVKLCRCAKEVRSYVGYTGAKYTCSCNGVCVFIIQR